jgi:hypothetical protein
MICSSLLKRWSLLACLGLSFGWGPARAGEGIPFRSSGELVIEAMEPATEPAPAVSVAETTVWVLRGWDTGVGTVLGQYTSEYRVLAWQTVANDGSLLTVYDGQFTSTAADGATLTVHLHAEAPAGATELEAQATVIGGTGRLANVQGSWTSSARLTPTGFVYESWGTLDRPGRPARR